MRVVLWSYPFPRWVMQVECSPSFVEFILSFAVFRIVVFMEKGREVSRNLTTDFRAKVVYGFLVGHRLQFCDDCGLEVPPLLLKLGQRDGSRPGYFGQQPA